MPFILISKMYVYWNQGRYNATSLFFCLFVFLHWKVQPSVRKGQAGTVGLWNETLYHWDIMVGLHELFQDCATYWSKSKENHSCFNVQWIVCNTVPWAGMWLLVCFTIRRGCILYECILYNGLINERAQKFSFYFIKTLSGGAKNQ